MDNLLELDEAKNSGESDGRRYKILLDTYWFITVKNEVIGIGVII